ncbi:MAG: chromosomal replication initiator protein DnaA [Candidatus Dadabacteria bacterium]|nr:MAG: chromosomal replication initiator protein DnaA [Candidatus Dadabacteria bacterium]
MRSHFSTIVENSGEIAGLKDDRQPSSQTVNVTDSAQPQLWNSLLSHLEEALQPEEYALWIQPLQPVQVTAKEIVAGVPNRFFEQWIRDNFSGLFQRAEQEFGVPIRFETLPEAVTTPSTTTGPAPATDPVPTATASSLHPDLNFRYTFEAFVPGSSNQFAHASCLAVSEHPGARYNPLFLYGGVGLGKTHLLHATGHAIFSANNNVRVLYLSSEQFMNEVVNAIRFERIDELRHRFRNQCDLLLIDDIQFLSGKERTQIEFFHIFNALYERGKQIVLTSDCVPREIPALEERLRSRFECGLIADIQPPEFEHRLAILRKKAADLGLRIPDDVLTFLATYIQSNVRELEGALTRLSAKASFEGRPVDVDFARRVLGDLIELTTPGVSADRILKVVAELHHLRVSDLRGRSRKKNIARPRQIAMYLCRQLTDLSLPEIGQRFGGKDHTTVLHSVRKIEQLRQEDPELDTLIQGLSRTLGRPS